MKPERNIEEILERYVTSASKEAVDLHCDQVLQRLRLQAHDTAQTTVDSAPRASLLWRRIVVASAVAAVLVALVITKGTVWRRSNQSNLMMLSDGSRVELREGSVAAV